ncbi:MAG: hypothetical protein ACK57G_14965 [Planctomycetota bacterium]
MKGTCDRTSNEMPYTKFAEDLNDWFECIDQVVWLCQFETPAAWLRIASESDFP